MSVEMGVTSARCIIIETAQDMKTFISLSKVRCLILHTFKTFSILCILKLISYCIVLLQ